MFRALRFINPCFFILTLFPQVSALTLLTVGMGLVQSGPKSSSVAIAAISTGRMVGIAAALASSLFSGLATILFEKVSIEYTKIKHYIHFVFDVVIEFI